MIPTGHLTQVSYIPEKFAVVGKILQLKNDDDTWTDGWRVISAGALNEDPPDAHAAIKQHRKATGDSAPKITDSNRIG